MGECAYCDIETDGYFEVGNPDTPLKIWCCEECYDTLIYPLSRKQWRIMSDLANIIIYQDTPCDLAG